MDLSQIDPDQVELLFSLKSLSRFGKLELNDLEEAYKEVHPEFKCHLEWDILMEQSQFLNCVKLIQNLNLSFFKSIRVQDPGAVQWLFSHTSIPIQLILETAHHNERSVLVWLKLLGKRVQRVIFSHEVPFEKMRKWNLPEELEKELLIVGKVLLFYTPRKLLAPLSQDEDMKEAIEAIANSEESPHKGFSLLENKHGTFMFHPRFQYLLGDQALKSSTWLTHGRIDNRQIKNSDWMRLYLSSLKKKNIVYESLRESFPYSSFKGFFKANKSDVLFKKLKNQRLLKSDEHYVGEVVDVLKGVHLGVWSKRKRLLKTGDKIFIHTPEGKKKEVIIQSMKNSSGDDIEESREGEIFFIPSVSGVSVRSQVLIASHS